MERSKRIGYIIILMAFILTYFALAGISFAKAYKTEYENVLEVVIDISGNGLSIAPVRYTHSPK